MDTPTPLTELEVINAMLETIGEAPINSLSGSTTSDVLIAKNVLLNVVREVCQTPWHFNTESDYTLTPDMNQYIYIPAQMIDVDLRDAGSYDIVVRGNKLYDKKNHTDKFSEPLKVWVQWYLRFEDLPEVARNYAMIRAIRKFQDKVLGDTQLHSYTVDDERWAYRRLRQYETQSGDYNYLRNRSSHNILRRNSQQGG